MKTEIIQAPELQAVEKSKAEQIRQTFQPMAEMLDTFEQQYSEITAEQQITSEVTAKAKRLRLDIAKVRIAAEKARKAQKEEYLRAGKAIDGVANILKWAVSEKEEKLKEIELHFERLEEQRLAALQAERVEQLSPYVEDAEERDLSSMEQDVWEAYLAAKKAAHKERIEAERKAEEERQRQELTAKIRSERQEFVAPVYDFFEHGEDLGEMRSAEFTKRLEAARKAKAEHQAEQERIKKERQELEAKLEAERQEQARKEAERKKAEQAAAEKARKEREAAEAKAKAERERHERELQVERDRIAKIEADLKAKKQAEEKAAKAAAMAPDKDKLLAYAQAIVDVPTPELKSAEIAAIAAKVRELQGRIKAFVQSEISKQ